MTDPRLKGCHLCGAPSHAPAHSSSDGGMWCMRFPRHGKSTCMMRRTVQDLHYTVHNIMFVS